jgi:hypothetical protein
MYDHSPLTTKRVHGHAARWPAQSVLVPQSGDAETYLAPSLVRDLARVTPHLDS